MLNFFLNLSGEFSQVLVYLMTSISKKVLVQL